MRPSLAPSSAKARQLSHLNSQLAQLQAHLADLQDIMRVTAVQAENIKALGGLNGALWVFSFSFPTPPFLFFFLFFSLFLFPFPFLCPLPFPLETVQRINRGKEEKINIC